MKIAVSSQITSLACEAGKALEEELDCQVILKTFESNKPMLRVSESMTMDEVRSILTVISPFSPPLIRAADLNGSELDAELVLTNAEPRIAQSIEILTLSRDIAAPLSKIVADFTQDNVRTKARWTDRDKVSFGRDVDPFTRDSILFALRRQGLDVRPASRKQARGKTKIQVQDRQQIDARKLLRIEVRCDDSQLAERLEQSGLAGLTVVRGPATPDSQFSLASNALAGHDFQAEHEEFIKEVNRMLAAEGIDPRYFPLKVSRRPTSVTTAVLHLPIIAARSGEIKRYAGDVPDRIHIKIRSDDHKTAIPLRDSLIEAGYSAELLSIPGMTKEKGFSLSWGAAKECPGQQAIIKSMVQTFLARVASPEYVLKTGDREPRKSPIRIALDGGRGKVEKDVVITLPIKAAEAGLIPSGVAEGVDFRVKAPELAHWKDVLEPLKLLGFGQFVAQAEPGYSRAGKTALLRYGGASLSLVQRVVDAIGETGIEVETEKAWGDGDDDLWLDLPDHPDHVKQEPAPGELAMSREVVPAAPAADEQIYPAIESDGSNVVFFNYLGFRFSLPRRTDISPHHPQLKEARAHAEMCMDQGSLATLNHLAYSVELGQPVLLEGETATSKTSTILHLAHLLNQPVMRLNLNGQSDVSELIGRHTQNEAGLWPWHDGAIPACMESGKWLVIDEGNLAVASCLERFNSALERSPSLVISEHDNRAVPISPHFRIFFTMNPATYAGRNVLSPAWRDRFSGYRYCPPPGEQELLQMLNYLVFGEQPAIRYHNRWIKAENLFNPPFLFLQDLPDIRGWLARLARLHCSLLSMVNTTGGGTLALRQKEKPVFSRRVMYAVLEEIQNVIGHLADHDIELSDIFDKVIDKYYVGRFTSEEDRDNVQNLKQAIGFVPSHYVSKVVPLFSKRGKPGVSM